MSAYSQAVLLDNPVDYWRLGEAAGSFADSGSNAIAAVPAGGVTQGVPSLIPSDQANLAASFNGTTGIANVAGLVYDGGVGVTLECWNKPAGSTGNVQRMVWAGRAAGGAGVGLGFTVTPNWRFTTFGHADYDFTAGPTFGTVYFLAVTLNADTTATLYINGSPVQTVAGAAPTLGSTSGSLGGSATTVPGEFYNGVLDEVALYSTALAAARIQAHWQAALGGGAEGGGSPFGSAFSEDFREQF